MTKNTLISILQVNYWLKTYIMHIIYNKVNM